MTKRETCSKCGAVGATLGGEHPRWWWVREGICIACFRHKMPDPRDNKRVRAAYVRIRRRKEE